MTNVLVENNDNQHITLASFNKLVGVLDLGIKIGVFLDITPKVDTPITSRNWPKCNHSIYDYMQLLVICNYIWTFL